MIVFSSRNARFQARSLSTTRFEKSKERCLFCRPSDGSRSHTKFVPPLRFLMMILMKTLIYLSHLLLADNPFMALLRATAVVIRLSETNVLTPGVKEVINSSNIGLLWTAALFGFRWLGIPLFSGVGTG